MSARPSRETTVAQLGGALHAALSTLDGPADGTILPEQVAEHVMLWQTTYETYRPQLPEHAWHMGRSVRAALGEAPGRVVLSSAENRMVGHPLAEHNEQRNQTGRRYLIDCIDWFGTLVLGWTPVHLELPTSARV